MIGWLFRSLWVREPNPDLPLDRDLAWLEFMLTVVGVVIIVWALAEAAAESVGWLL